jgi:hypothetical protein
VAVRSLSKPASNSDQPPVDLIGPGQLAAPGLFF